MRSRLILVLLLAFTAFAARKKDRPEKTQELKEAPEPPAVAFADAARVTFHVSPLSAKGLLAQQTRDALAAILRANGGVPVAHLRAFVAGSGDLRRIGQIVGDVFTKKNLPLPSLSVVQTGPLPMAGAQIVIESISESKKPVNPEGVFFIPAQDSVDRLAAKVGSSHALAVTCYIDDAAKGVDLASTLAARFPGAAIDVVQAQRLPPRPVTECEAAARGGKQGRYAFSGTQAAFGFEEKDATLAFQRVGRELSAAGVDPSALALTRIYAITRPIADLALRIRNSPGEAAPIPVEGVSGQDAAFAVDVVAWKP